MADLLLDGIAIGPDHPCYVIAELGHNHGGNVVTACQMVHAAATARCHAVKLQKRDNATLYSRALLEKPYDHEHSYGRTYGEHRAALELDADAYQRIQRAAQHVGVTCFATAFDERSADFLADLGMPAYKIASGGLTDAALLRHVAGFGKPLIVSTGGGTWREVDDAVNLLTGTRAPFALLHCTAAYPCAFDELNLRCVPAMVERYPDVVIGWSCHVHNLSMAMMAYALGARILEAHVTLNRSSKGTDHAFSLEPATLTKLCKDLRRAHVALGDGVKRWYASEHGPISKMRRVQTPDGLQITGEVCPPLNDLSRAS